MDDREIDLVIQDQEIMDMMLYLLIHYTNSINGIKNSASNLKQAHMDQRLSKTKKKTLTTKEQNIIKSDIDNFVTLRILKIYKIMRTRAKISFKGLKA